jgi:Membrane proteins related to metalloendopeptidases
MAYIDDLKLKYPVDYIAITRGYTSSHFGADGGWNSNHGGPSVPLKAAGAGKISAFQEGRNNDTPNGGWGNYVKIDHGNGVYTLCGHIAKGSINALGLKVGLKVEQGQQIGIMGNTGNSYGNHVHFEVYLGGSGTGYRVDPVKYTYVYPDQYVSAGSALRDQLKYYTPPVTGLVGAPAARDTSIDQIEVIIDTLFARSRPEYNDNTKVGIIRAGLYKLTGITDRLHEDSNGFYWYIVEDLNGEQFAIARGSRYTEETPYTESLPAAVIPIPPTVDKDKLIAELQKENAEYRAALVTVHDVVKEAIA